MHFAPRLPLRVNACTHALTATQPSCWPSAEPCFRRTNTPEKRGEGMNAHAFPSNGTHDSTTTTACSLYTQSHARLHAAGCRSLFHTNAHIHANMAGGVTSTHTHTHTNTHTHTLRGHAHRYDNTHTHTVTHKHTHSH